MPTKRKGDAVYEKACHTGRPECHCGHNLDSNTENQLFVSVATFEGLLPAGDEGLL